MNARVLDGTCCRRAQITINIQVIRNRIEFPNPITATVSEFAATDSEVIEVQASGGAGVLEYSITDGNQGNSFAIDPSSGLITVNEMLDFETRSSYSLTIHVQSIGTNVNDSTQQMITVTDENESPFFESLCVMTSTCAVTVAEDIAASTALGFQLMADDPDLPGLPNGMIRFRISDPSLPFRVNEMGVLSTGPGQQLDREDRDSYMVSVIVEDEGSPSLAVSTEVLVTVSDVNDNAPVFLQGPTLVDVQENSQVGSDIAQYIATDDDIGSNAAIEYTLSPLSVPFELDPVSGLLSVAGLIDYEDTQLYMVTVTASNPDGTSESVMTTINVTDLNDNAPIFSPDLYSEMVTEHFSIGGFVVRVTANDRDSGSNGDIKYAIASGNADNAFTIDDTSGNITVNNDIDREITTTFALRIQAQDLGNPSQSSFVTVDVKIVDINDNAPQFNPDLYTATLREDTSLGFDILYVVAFDIDEPGNPNSEIAFTIVSGDPTHTFTLDNSSGLIQLAKTLDFEDQSSYQLCINATDQGTPQRSDTAMVNIQVTNVNEFAPVLNESQTVNISELTPVPEDIVSFTAQDLDAGAAIEYGISSGNDEGKFSINMTTGLVTLVQSLDFEDTTFYELEISASDGQSTDSATLTVYVIDENEFAPEFTGDTNFEVMEEMPAGTLIGRVNATDGDGSLRNSRITYSLLQSILSQYVSINSTSGEIRTVEQLDREQLTQVFSPPASMRSADVIAQDNGSPSLQTTTTITVTLQDINDNSPVFAADSYENSFRENLDAGMVVFQLSAVDVDLGSNAIIKFSFSIPGRTNPPFEIINDTVRTTEPLDREEQETYDFLITATDQGDMPRSSTVNGSLTVLDENDNDPNFTMPIYEDTVIESVQIGELNFGVHADDPDKGVNGQVRYVLVGQEAPGVAVENDFQEGTFFEIELESGVLNHVTPFDYEIQTFINLTIMAYDLGVPRRSSFAEVHITVTNFDESPPIFPEINCDQEVPENIEVGEVVRHCFANDPDNTTAEGEVGIFYTLSTVFDPSVAEYFEVNETTGEIKTIRELDFDEGPTSFELSISARDSANRFALIQRATITVTDVNDNAPQFRNAPYEYALTNSRLRSYVRQITSVDAFDLDSLSTGNGRVVYSIDLEGIVRSESNMETVLPVVATDKGSPPRSANTTVTVTFEAPCILQRYEIHTSSGIITVDALCSVEISPTEANVTLGRDHSIACTVFRNGATTYQWIHNGSTITSSVTLPQSRQQATREIVGVGFDDGGDYSCKATTAAGSLQAAPSSVVNIQG